MSPRFAGLAVLGAGLLAAVALAGPGTARPLEALARLVALWGASMALAAVALAARVPVVERRLGQTHALAIHRVVGPAAAVLITAHVGLVLLTYRSDGQDLIATGLELVLGTPWMLPATAGFVAIVALSVSSWHRVRARMRYETWWAAHLYMYLAVALAFAHEIFVGPVLPAGSVRRGAWVAAHVAVLVAVLAFRVVAPLMRSLRHRPCLVGVTTDGATLVVTVSVVDLDSLDLQGGQFMYWRILARGLWWQAHPYSVLDASDGCIRLAVRATGDYAAALGRSAPGTRLVFEGPYGVMTAARAIRPGITLIGAGAGLAPLLGVARDAPRERDVRIVAAVRDRDPLLEDEVARVAAEREHRTGRAVPRHVARGPLSPSDLTAAWIEEHAPGVADDDVYVCGPPGFTRAILDALTTAGVPPQHVHTEVFAT